MSTAATSINYDVKNLELADLGKKRIEWANQSMKVLQIIRKEFIKNQPLQVGHLMRIGLIQGQQLRRKGTSLCVWVGRVARPFQLRKRTLQR